MDERDNRFVPWGRSLLPDFERERLRVATAEATPRRSGWRGLLDRLRDDYDRLW